MSETRDTRAMDTTMSLAYRQLATRGMALVVAAIAAGLMAIVAVLGPMRTVDTLTLLQRLAYFGIITITGVPVLFASGFFILYVLRNVRVLYVMLALVLMCAFVAVPWAALSMVLYGAFHGGAFPTVSYRAVYAFGILISGFGTGFSFYVLYQKASRTTHRNSVSKANGAATDSLGSPAGTDAADLTQTGAVATSGEGPNGSAPGKAPELRLPPEIGRDIVYAHVSGHYVEVVTTSGRAVVYSRLSDVAEAMHGHGMQTHRSYWAAYRHIRRMHSDGHRVLLHLTGGRKVPVGRAFRSSVRAYLKRRPAP